MAIIVKTSGSTTPAAFAKYVRPSVPGCPEPLLLDAILQSAIEYCASGKMMTAEFSVTTSAGVRSYSMSGLVPTGLEVVEVNRVMRSGLDLDPSSLNEAHRQRLTVRSDLPRAFWVEEPDSLILAPTPNSTETLTVIAMVTPTINSTTVPDFLLGNKHYLAIAAGARSLLLSMPKTPWYDPQEAAMDRAVFDAYIEGEIYKRARGGVHKPLRTVASPF